EPGIFVCQPPLNDFRCLYRLNRIILCEVADQDVRVEADHRRAVRFETPTAASAAASVISAIVTGRLRLDLRMPRKAAAGSFGSQNNATIGVDKELNPIARFQLKMLANSLRYRRLTFDSERRLHSNLLHYFLLEGIP